MVGAVPVIMWRAVAVFRVTTLIVAGVVALHRLGGYAHPAGALIVLAVMSTWTLAVTAGYRRLGRLPLVLLLADVGFAVAAVVSSRAVQPARQVAAGAATLPGPWAAAPVLACAIAGGPVGGLSAAAVIFAADVIERGAVTGENVSSAVLLVLGRTVVGYSSRLLVRLRAGELRAAAEAERGRLAADIHDSVLQVLALVSRRGGELGGEAAELGRLAGAQAIALRALMTARPTTEPGQADLGAALSPLQTPSVSLALPAHAVVLPSDTVRAVHGAVAAALTNVTQHAPGARAWILLEQSETEVCVTIRDDGPGFEAGRLAEAEADGRLGVRLSIRDRLTGVGGHAVVESAPGQGTEVELRVRR